ncbi:MAG: hypothetical protein KC478_09280 [Bacteriovoracaceae bacterium]|nr:hypothetical protein [Bacteriovoracaceae bacterium]
MNLFKNILIKALTLTSLMLPAQAAHLVSTGTFVPFVNKAQTSDSGATQKFELTPYVSYGQQFHISGPHYFMPELGLAYYNESAKKTKKRILFFHYDFSYVLSTSFILRYGLTTYWQTISGDGGTVRLRNGQSYTNYPALSGSQSTYYSTLDLGGEFFFMPNRSARLDFNMMNARDFDNRAFNYILTYNWYL